MKKPILVYDSRGPSGNIFCILSQLRRILQKQRKIEAYNAIWERVRNAGSYKEALEIIGSEVTLEDISE